MISIAFAVSALFAVTGSSVATDISQPTGVVELFTSQGCYSCPPADKLIGEFAEGGELLALSWHVDYWDYLGWKDSFASKANTQRQYAYAKTLRERQVYTPQAVINGRTHAVGSDKGKILQALEQLSGNNQGMIVPINASITDETISIDIANTIHAADATLYMIFFNKRHDVKIKRGENGGKTLTYYNVVHDSQALGMVKANGLQTEFPITEMKKRGYDGCALILQKTDDDGNPSVIVGATVINQF